MFSSCRRAALLPHLCYSSRPARELPHPCSVPLTPRLSSRQVLDVMHTSAVAPRSRDPVFDIFFSCVAPVLAESEALVQLVMLDGSFQPPVEIGVVNIDIAELLRPGADERPVWQGWYPLCPPSSLNVHVQRRPGTWSTARPATLVSGEDGGTCEVQLSIQVCRPVSTQPVSP